MGPDRKERPVTAKKEGPGGIKRTQTFHGGRDWNQGGNKKEIRNFTAIARLSEEKKNRDEGGKSLQGSS